MFARSCCCSCADYCCSSCILSTVSQLSTANAWLDWDEDDLICLAKLVDVREYVVQPLQAELDHSVATRPLQVWVKVFFSTSLIFLLEAAVRVFRRDACLVVLKQCSWKRTRNDLGLLTGWPALAVMHSHNYQTVCLSGALLKLFTRNLCLPSTHVWTLTWDRVTCMFTAQFLLSQNKTDVLSHNLHSVCF